MGRKTSLTSVNQISEINMTPLMDLTFILLITFIITFPLIEQGVPINLPKGQAKDLQDQQSRSISLDAKGNFYFDETPIAMGDLQREMARVSEEEPNATVYVRADAEIKYGKVAALLKMLHDNNITRTALVMAGEEAGK
ncbi:ExbD/TolR family protein [Verrucomicrobiota bacterium]